MEVLLERIVLIALAGAAGAVSRYAVQRAANAVAGHPTLWGTFVVNVTGAFALGLLVALSETRLNVSPILRTTLAVGFLGAYTTFSTLMLDTVDRFELGDYMAVAANLAGSLVVGVAAMYAGMSLGRTL